MARKGPTTTASDAEALAELGRRLARVRLGRNWTQEGLAEEAGVSRATVKRLEAGRSTQLGNLVRILRALGLAHNLEALAPRPDVRPLEALEHEGGRRRRATSSPAETRRPKKGPAAGWRWGDEGKAAPEDGGGGR